ncbi:hypothetical protein FPOAC2_02464 [Fusarium poae]|uniref:hypothetical protein n=1 Tax=Fusarium poae TaxID=36050 RepID=UPI001CE9FB9E|nr:hypothetical protein FPOAC1_002371 [Fusarium poae]KAG8676368.1 hypothetical protein FPOAC1_002371 [Fusarium poae]
MARRLVLSFFLASALYSSGVPAGPCRPKPVSSYAVSSVATSDVSTDLTGLTSSIESLTVIVSASASTGISTDRGETDAAQTTGSLSLSLPDSLVTTATTYGETTTVATGLATETFSSMTDSNTVSSYSATTGLGADTSSFTSGSVATDSASYTTSGATADANTDTASDDTTDVSSFNTGSATTVATYTTSDITTDVSSLATDSATTDASTHTISQSETGTTTGPATTTSADYCSNAEWQNDALIASFEKTMTYAIGVCATAIEPVTTVAATGSPETTETEIIAVTEDHADETKIVIDAPSTNFVAGPDRTVTAVRRDGIIEIIEPKTIYDTVARTTIELPTAYETVYTTNIEYIGSTSVDTVYDVVDTQTTLMVTDTTEITAATSTDVVTETITSIESIPTTSTEYVVTGTTIKFAPGMTIHVTNSRTFVVYLVPSTRTHVLYTTTDYLTSAWTTVTVQSTDTDYTTVPTETVDVTTATNTVDETIVTSTDTDFATSIVTTNEWTTETSVSTSTSTKLLPPKYTQHEFPWLQNKKRAIASAALKARVALPDSLEEQWINEFGESHFHSACSCLLPFSLPTRTVYASAELETIIEKSTTIDKIYGDTVTLTITTAATVTTHKTLTETTIVDGTTSIETRTIHKDVTQTVLSTPTAQSLITKVVVNDDVKQVTKEIAVIDTITLYGIATGYTWMEVTRTQDIYDLRSKLFPVVQTIDIAETSTSTLPTTTVETTVEVTSTALSTADETIYDAFTSIVPVAITDVKKFTYTKTVFTDATSVYSIEATNTVGTIATTTLTTFTTVANGVTSTITTILSTDVTVTAQAIATETCAMPIKDGDFEYEPGTSPWYASYKSKYDWNKIWLDDTHGKVLQTAKLYNNTNFILWQDIKSCKGVTFSCDYQFWIDKYYYVKGDKKPGKGKNDNSDSAYYWWTPYVWTYWNDNPTTIGERWPRNAGETGRWMNANIQFQTTGKVDTLWIYSASPQWPWEGDNFLMLDNYRCKPIAFKGPNGPVGGFRT